jgi:uncharacterized protein (DUF433 family)
MRIVEIGEHLVVDPRVCHGKLTFKGTRVPVETVLYFLSEGRGFRQLLKGWPEVKRAALEEAIQLASAALVRQAKAKARAKGKAAHEPAHS